jgi:hypothetical protein
LWRVSDFAHFSQIQYSSHHWLPWLPNSALFPLIRIARSPQKGQASAGCLAKASSIAASLASNVAIRFPNNIVRFAQATILVPKDISAGVNMVDPSFEFSRADKGLIRFPPNVEQITVEHETTCSWLITRRNDVVLRFPLAPEDCRHLADLLTRDRS